METDKKGLTIFVGWRERKIPQYNKEPTHQHRSNGEIKLVTHASSSSLSAILMQTYLAWWIDEFCICQLSSHSCRRTILSIRGRSTSSSFGNWSAPPISIWKHFKLLTDCKAIELIVHNSNSNLLEHWNLRLQSYNFEVKYAKGNEISYLLRHTSNS